MSNFKIRFPVEPINFLNGLVLLGNASGVNFFAEYTVLFWVYIILSCTEEIQGI